MLEVQKSQKMKFAFSARPIHCIFAESDTQSINTNQEAVFIPWSVVPIFPSITVQNKVYYQLYLKECTQNCCYPKLFTLVNFVAHMICIYLTTRLFCFFSYHVIYIALLKDGNTEMKTIHEQQADIGVPQHQTSQFCNSFWAIIAIIKFAQIALISCYAYINTAVLHVTTQHTLNPAKKISSCNINLK